MGVAVLQLYTGKDNRTGPQTIELLTRRIVNLGAVQAGQVGDPSVVNKRLRLSYKAWSKLSE